VTATVTNAIGNPKKDIDVVFSVTGANSASGTQTTDAAGTATFCYTGTVAGVDVIMAFADANKNGVMDLGEPIDTPPRPGHPGRRKRLPWLRRPQRTSSTRSTA
jgi:hypothetical protein